MTTEMSPIITNSQVQTAMVCPRMHLFKYVFGWRSEVDAKPLRIGSAFHEGLKLMAEGIPPMAAISQVALTYDQLRPAGLTPEQSFDWDIDRQLVATLLAAYEWRWREEPLEFVAVELPFEIPLRNPATGRSSSVFRLGGKIDAIIRTADGRLALLERKTTSRDIGFESDFWRQLDIARQPCVYYRAAQELGYPIEGILYDVERKPAFSPSQVPELDENGLKIVVNAAGERLFKANGEPYQSVPKNAEEGTVRLARLETPQEYGQRVIDDIEDRPDRYLARRWITRLDVDIDAAMTDLWQCVQGIRICRNDDRWPRNDGACIGFGRCRYFDICSSGTEIDPDIVPEGFIKIDLAHIHTELED